ncbi:MAG TPA: hypothetical protein IAC02_02705 [Candidatus Coprovivens excrementavium]|nr:hypothetical protein [Candidatus Coprovivens excrementavium]
MTPKFRVWNEKTESFIDYGDLMLDLKNGKVYSGDVGIPEYTIDVTNQVILMQYTGCRDKNGIEIYEGDVIKDKYDKTWLVQWYVGAFVITNKIPDSDGQTSTYSHFSNVSNHHFYFEVIGNMWENPELLEVVK